VAAPVKKLKYIRGGKTMEREGFLGVIILESLADPTIINEVEVIKESDIKAPPDDPYPIWRRRLVFIETDKIQQYASKLASSMKEDFYNHFVNDEKLVVVFKGRYFILDKYDKSSWNEMISYGETVRVGQKWTTSIPVEKEKLL
jgi:hypothetical protein